MNETLNVLTTLDTVTIVTVASLLSSVFVQAFTAITKKVFDTSGLTTVLFSLVFSIIIGGFVGYLSLGQFSNLSGLEGAIQAIIIIIVSWAKANGQAIYDKHYGARSISDTLNQLITSNKDVIIPNTVENKLGMSRTVVEINTDMYDD